MKKCPFCAEDIQDAAIVCRYCNRELTAVAPTATATAAPPAARRRRMNRAAVVVLALAGMVLFTVVGFVVIALSGGSIPSPTSSADDHPPLKFFVRPELRGLRVTNDTDRTMTGCEITIADRYSRTETFLKNDAEVLPYDTFRTGGGVELNDAEGFARVQAGGVTIRCEGRTVAYGR